MTNAKPYSNVHSQILGEVGQIPDTRKALFTTIEKALNRPLVTFFTSFGWPVSIDDDDADMLQSVLSGLDLSNGFALLINSPGGDGLAAERIINVCRSYSGTDEYWAIVVGKAKSAATIICLGASKIYMAPMSELGPVDPQIFRVEDGQRKIFSAHSLVASYNKLFNGATKSKGRLEPYLQQLAYFDAREIAKFNSLIELSGDISCKCLANGMLKGTSKTKIKEKIKLFLDPAAGTVAHGRPIYMDEAKHAGLTIVDLDVKGSLWRQLYELYVRTDKFVSREVACKAVESKKVAFHVPAQ